MATPCLSSSGNQMFGGVPGSFAVTRDGSAGYSIPLRVPPGTAGLQPDLSLAYTSGAANGLLGMGFSLSGVSAITRVGQTEAQDKRRTAVAYDQNDRLALDGARLMPVTGLGYFDGAIYHTEIESWQKVVPSNKGAVPGQHGPVFFTVRTRDGKVLVYGDKPGQPPNASIPASSTNPSIRVWALASATDRNGNTMTFTYQADAANNNSYPSRIDYTSHGALAASRSIQFTYGPRQDPFTTYAGGFPVTTSQILQSIQTFVAEDLVTTWSFSYQYGLATGRAQLVCITESGTDGLSLPPTVFTWQDGAPGLQAPLPLAPTPAYSTVTLPMDLDGNGLTDVVVATNNSNQLGLSFLQSIPTPGGAQLAPPADLLRGQQVPYGTLYPMDVNGDGAMDLVVVQTQNFTTTDLTLLLATKDDHGIWSLKLSGEAGKAGPASLPAGIIASLDVNGDGRVDLVCASESTQYSGMLALQILLSTGTSFSPEPVFETKTVPYYSGATLIALDFNGDGMTDLLYTYANPDETIAAVLFLSTGTSFEPASNLFTTSPLSGATLFAADLNGDGRDDLVQITNPSSPVLQTWFSNGASAAGAQFIDGQNLSLGQFSGTLPQVLPFDVNGDGLPDLALVLQQPDDTTTITILLNSGTEFRPLGGTATASGGIFLPMDINGDGKTEVVSVTQNVDEASLAVLLTDGPYPDLVTSILNPLGGILNVQYLPLTNSCVYSESLPDGGAGTAGSTIPTLSQFAGRVTGSAYSIGSSQAVVAGSTRATKLADFPKYVVSLYERVPGGTGTGLPVVSPASTVRQTYTWIYSYAQGLIDLTGRGWLGFAQVTAQDDDSQTVTTTAYNQPFPTTGYPSAVMIACSSKAAHPGALMKTMEYVYQTETSPPVLRMTIEQVVEHQVTTNFYTYADPVSPKADCQLVRTHTYDAYGNQLTIEESGSAYGAPLYMQFEYENRPRAWLLGFLTSQTTSADPAGQEILAKRTFTYGPRMNLSSVTDRVTEQYSNTVKYRYNAFGNCIEKTDASGAKTRYFFEATQTFPSRVVSPPNANGKTLIARSTYDPRFGVAIESFDYNGVKRTQSVDGLGRVSASYAANPRGKGEVLLSSVSWNNDSTGIYRETVTLVDWGGKTKWTRHYVDGFGRVYRITALGPDGKRTTVIEKEFNSDNQVIHSSLPHYEGEHSATLLTRYDPYMRVTHVHRASSSGIVKTEFSYPNTNETVRIDAAGTQQQRRTAFRSRAYAGHPQVVERKDDLGYTTHFTYDPLGRLRTLVDPLGVKKVMEYDDLGRLVASSAHLAETVFYSETTAYDAANRQITRTDAKKNVVVSNHDQLGRLIELSAQAGSGGAPQTTSFTWDGGAREPGLRGRPSGATLPDGTAYSYWYDRFGSRKETTVTIAGQQYSVNRAYTPLAELEEVVFPDRTIERFERNAAGVLTGVTYGPRPHLASVAYTSHNAFATAHRAVYGNGVTEVRSYDDLNRLGSIAVHDSTSAGLVERIYEYYPNDAIQSITDNLGNASESYQYDQAGRLLAATGPYGQLNFQYDGGGNLQLKDGITYTSDGHQVQTGKDSSGNVVFQGTYDLNGNLFQATRGSETTSYTFDALDHLTDVVTAAGATTISYDHVGRRLTESPASGDAIQYVTPEYCVYAGSGATVALLGGAFGTMAAYASGSDPNAPPSGVTYLHKNHLGSAILMTAGGASAESVGYTPFGAQETPPSSVIPTFTDKPFDLSTQLYAFGGRYYDPGLGRFISHDVMPGASLLRSDAFHGYAYVANDPTNLIDPYGYSTGDSGSSFWSNLSGDFSNMFSAKPYQGIGDWFHNHWQEVLSYSLDGLMIIGGVMLTAATFGGASVILASMAAGALLGGGISGLISNASQTAQGQTFSWSTWGIAVGSGAAAGAASGMLSGTMAWAVARSASMVAQGVAAQAAEDVVTRVFTSALKEAVFNTVGSAVGTVVSNRLNGYSLGQGLGASIAGGAVFGFASGGAADVIGGAFASKAESAILDNAGGARNALEGASDIADMAKASAANRELANVLSDSELEEFSARTGFVRVSDDTDTMINRFRLATRVVNALPGVFIEGGAQGTTQFW